MKPCMEIQSFLKIGKTRKMNLAVEIFTRVPKTHNCAQAVAAGCGLEGLIEELKPMGGGRVPEGRCGAFQAVFAATPEARHAELRRRFAKKFCRELKRNGVASEARGEAGALIPEESMRQ